MKYIAIGLAALTLTACETDGWQMDPVAAGQLGSSLVELGQGNGRQEANTRATCNNMYHGIIQYDPYWYNRNCR